MKRYLIVIILSILLGLGISIAQAGTTHDTVTEASEKYNKVTDMLEGAFNMCDCIKFAKTNYIVNTIQARKVCLKAVEGYLMKKSELSGEIETAVILECY